METQEILETVKTWLTYGLFGSSYMPLLYLARKTFYRAKWKVKQFVFTVALLFVYTTVLIAVGCALGIIDINSIWATISK